MAAAVIMAIELYDYQMLAIDLLKTGSILCGGVGSGKSRTAIAYYFLKVCEGKLRINGKGDFAEMKNPKDLYIITTARKRDTLEWEGECSPFLLSSKRELSISGTKVTVDSWNNIAKYKAVQNSFFIFDEQRLVGSGAWVKSFLKITKSNKWILLSATPGDTWMDYAAVFIANGFYKNRTEFITRHVVYNRFKKYPSIDHYIDCKTLIRHKQDIIVPMKYKKYTITHDEDVIVPFDKDAISITLNKRWNVFENKPIKTISELCYLMRRIVNSDPGRIEGVCQLIEKNDKVIVFYNFDYELEILRQIGFELGITTSEWNGHNHEPIPKTDKWMYLVQYTAGAEGWNCIETNCIIFYSQNYSYKIMVQSAGRIDRLNTPFSDLFYYHVRSDSPIDLAILKSLTRKENFNENHFAAM
jgi:hypothetical protein